jgi:hypothetical protein
MLARKTLIDEWSWLHAPISRVVLYMLLVCGGVLLIAMTASHGLQAIGVGFVAGGNGLRCRCAVAMAGIAKVIGSSPPKKATDTANLSARILGKREKLVCVWGRGLSARCPVYLRALRRRAHIFYPHADRRHV